MSINGGNKRLSVLLDYWLESVRKWTNLRFAYKEKSSELIAFLNYRPEDFLSTSWLKVKGIGYDQELKMNIVKLQRVSTNCRQKRLVAEPGIDRIGNYPINGWMHKGKSSVPIAIMVYRTEDSLSISLACATKV